MNALAGALARLAVDLAKLHPRWALVGGVAISIRSRPRATFDLDLAVAVSGDREAEALVRALVEAGYRHEAFHLEHEGVATERLAMVRLSPAASDVPVPIDLLFASSGLEAEIVAAAETLEVLPAVHVPVARVEHLIALKILAGRLQDQADAVALLAIASTDERVRAQAALIQITERGFARGKDLLAELEALERRLASPG
ncbi:MAG: nucleotidyl transferase AbiEii/AbiGii toxin family protein [Acidobacteriota bacterium]